MIIKSKLADVKFYRNIIFGENDIKTSDKIGIRKKNVLLDKLTIGGKFSLMYIPSTKYFHLQELVTQGYNITIEELKKLNTGKTLSVSRIINKPLPK